MIGQEDLRNTIKKQIEDDTFPHFAIIVGEKGSGKKTLINEIFNHFKVYKGFTVKYTLPDIKVDSVRQMITAVYKTHNTLYVISDADNMSISAQNSLLKIVEECPNNNYFIMTLQDKNNTLETIRSRASIYTMGYYNQDTIEEYAKSIDNSLVDYVSICSNLGQVELLNKMGAKQFYDYVKLTVENIAKVSGANAFKIADKIALKDEEDKYDLNLFLIAFMEVGLKLEEDLLYTDKEAVIKWNTVIQITLGLLRNLKIKSINRSMLFDRWILDVRKALM